MTKRKFQLSKIAVPERLSGETPRYFTEAYKGMEEDMAEDIYSAMYYKRRDQLEKEGKVESELDTATQSLLIANAIMDAAPQADEMADGMQRAKFRILMSVEKNKLYFLAREEYSTLEEYLKDRLPMASGENDINGILFLLTEFLPLLNKIGGNFDPHTLLKMRDSWSRTKESIPFLRQQLKVYLNATKSVEQELKAAEESKTKMTFRETTIEEGVKEKDELNEAIVEQEEKIEALKEQKEEIAKEATEQVEQAVSKVLDVIGDPNIDATGPTGVSKVLQSGKTREHLMIQGDKILCSESTVFYVEAPKGYGTAVESGLRSFVEFSVRESQELFKHYQKLKGERKMLNIVKGGEVDADAVTEETEKVDVIASGYEWICLSCHTVNHEIEWHEPLACGKCGTTFGARPPEHCIG
jgi:hypothetical protein